MATSTSPISRLAQRRQPQHERELRLVLGGERELRLEVLGQLRPHLLAREEVVERAERAIAARLELEHLLVRRDGVFGAAESLVVDLRRGGVEGLAVACVAGLLDAPLDDADEVLPPLRPREELLERGERLRVPGIERQHLVVRLRRAIDVAEAVVDRRRFASSSRARAARRSGSRPARRRERRARAARPSPRRSARSRRASRRAPDRHEEPTRGRRTRAPGRSRARR